MSVVDDLKRELAAARSERQGYENDWRDYVDYTAPDLDRAFNSVAGVQVSGMAAWKRSAARERSRRLYDGTAVWLLDRLVSGIESLTMPKGFNWARHRLRRSVRGGADAGGAGIFRAAPGPPVPHPLFGQVRLRAGEPIVAGVHGEARDGRSVPCGKRGTACQHPHAGLLPLCAAARGLSGR